MNTEKIVEVNMEFEFVVTCALRYAIGRMSYAPSLISDYIKSIWNKLSDACKIRLRDDLNREIEYADRYLLNNVVGKSLDPLGYPHNRETWLQLKKWMEERI